MIYLLEIVNALAWLVTWSLLALVLVAGMVLSLFHGLRFLDWVRACLWTWKREQKQKRRDAYIQARDHVMGWYAVGDQV